MTDEPQVAGRERRRKAVARWLTTVGWALVIYSLSTSTFGASFTARVLGALLALLEIAVSPTTFALLHLLVRKCAHVTEYAIFAILLYRCFDYEDKPPWRPRSALWSLLLAAAYSLTDELHQAFVGRGASLIDVAIDAFGAALGLLALFAMKSSVPPKRASAPLERNSDAAEAHPR